MNVLLLRCYWIRVYECANVNAMLSSGQIYEFVWVVLLKRFIEFNWHQHDQRAKAKTEKLCATKSWSLIDANLLRVPFINKFIYIFPRTTTKQTKLCTKDARKYIKTIHNTYTHTIHKSSEEPKPETHFQWTNGIQKHHGLNWDRLKWIRFC